MMGKMLDGRTHTSSPFYFLQLGPIEGNWFERLFLGQDIHFRFNQTHADKVDNQGSV